MPKSLMQQSPISFGRISIYIITLLMGGCGIAYEYTFSKIASDLLGNSVQQWAIIIGLMMFCMGVGSDIQKYIKDQNLFDRFILFEVVLGIIGGFGPLFLIYIFGMSRDHFALVHYSLSIVIGLFIGLEIPILARINERFTPQLKLNLAGILRMDYIGAFIGACVWIFVLLRFFTITQVSLVLGIVNNTVAGIALIYFSQYASRKILLSSLVVSSITALGIGIIMAPTWTAYAEQKLFMHPIIFSKTTPYQHIVLTRNRSDIISCYINGHLQFSSSDEFIYHEFLVHPVMQIAEKKRRILILGGGDGLALREVLKYDQVEQVMLIDIDPQMTELARMNPYLKSLNEGSLDNAKVTVLKNKEFQPGSRKQVFIKNRARPLVNEFKPVAEVTVINMDADKFVEQATGTFDVVILDFPDPNSLELAKLYSQQFYRKVMEKMTRTGVMVQQSSSPFFTRKAFWCVGKTMKESGLSAIPFHENVPSFGEWGWWLACKQDYLPDKILKKRSMDLDSITVSTRYLIPPLLHASFYFGKNINEYQDCEPNTIFNNIIYNYYIEELHQYF